MALGQEERSLLAKFGFFFCREGLVPEAEDVFGGLAESAPEKDGPVIGLALCRIIAGETEQAVAMLDERLRRGGELAPALRLYKLLALGMGGDMNGAKTLRDEMERDGFGQEVKTADALLADLRQYQSR